jgi:hypothetical protein
MRFQQAGRYVAGLGAAPEQAEREHSSGLTLREELARFARLRVERPQGCGAVATIERGLSALQQIELGAERARASTGTGGAGGSRRCGCIRC